MYISDCYVATTGLPNPQSDHAVIMAKFANDCMVKLQQLIQEELVNTLGSDTANLAMRFGLHSGPVTAGVLRGEKSRFQIFGDTVNTVRLFVCLLCFAHSACILIFGDRSRDPCT